MNIKNMHLFPISKSRVLKAAENPNIELTSVSWPIATPTLESVEADCRKHHAEFILRDCIRYLIISKTTGEIVGRCAFPPAQVNWSIPQFGISYFIRKSQRSKGFATEAAYAMAVLAFDVSKAKKNEIFCESQNMDSAKIPVKLGLKLEYSQKGGWPTPDGTLALLHAYSASSKSELALPN